LDLLRLDATIRLSHRLAHASVGGARDRVPDEKAEDKDDENAGDEPTCSRPLLRPGPRGAIIENAHGGLFHGTQILGGWSVVPLRRSAVVRASRKNEVSALLG
jgi:hypothetical protein